MGVKMRERKGTVRYLTFGLLTLLFTISMAFTAFGGQYEDATAAYKRGDFATAFRIFKALAEQGDASAQVNLALMFDAGEGVPQDYILAHMWFNLAVSALEGKKQEQTVKDRDNVASKMTSAQIAEAEQLAKEWKPKKEGK
jgi:TPR repeat protein